MSTGSRPYASPLRAAGALGTRRRIRAAAHALFERQGFAGATIAGIAAEAGVSVQTVYATFGSKGAILREMMDELEELAGGEDDGAALLDEADHRRQIALFGGWIRRLFEGGAPLFRAAVAARNNAGVAAMIDTGNRRRLEGATILAAGWAERVLLRPGLTAGQAAETLWLLTSAELFLSSVDALKWTADRYEQWLVDTASRELFGS